MSDPQEYSPGVQKYIEAGKEYISKRQALRIALSVLCNIIGWDFRDGKVSFACRG